MDEVGDDLSVDEQRRIFREWLRGQVGNAPVRLVETHVSILGLSADRVWKLKKAVRFPFVDLSTAARRRENAEREVALNRRFAPDVYLGVVPLVDGGGTVVDTVVEMRAMPENRRLAAMAVAGGAVGCVDDIAAALVRVHRAAPSGARIDAAATPEALAHLWVRNLAELRPFAESGLDADLIEQVGRDAGRYIAGRDPLFAQRINDGRIRDGHGDLLADDVFCLDDGPRFLDCLEFDDRLRFGDVLGDVAFLAMDLERLGRADLAARLFDGYRRHSGDAWPESLADFYVAYRAGVRSKVACLSGSAETARALLKICARHLRRGRVQLVLVGGAPATGKTTFARELQRRTGWIAVHSDEERKRLAGLEPTTSAAGDLDTGLYTPEWNDKTYEALLARARTSLERGESVILDATWSDTERRVTAERLAEATFSDCVALVLELPGELADARARTRAAEHRDASDASDAVSGALRARFAPWPGATRLDATGATDELVTSVLGLLDRDGSGAARS